LGTACTAEHVIKLFRFTDQVVFSFDGDAAGRRAAGRALGAALPHATDLRTIRFLFLPPEHDPDSFVRERGAAAFEQEVTAAVPLSRMLLQTAQDGCDLSLAEGRARMLAQAKPMIESLPAGALREQLVAEAALAGGTTAGELKALWGSAIAPRTSTTKAQPPARSAPRRSALARHAATLLDRAVWLLLQRSSLWQEIGAEDHERLAAQPAPFGTFFALLDRCMHDHGVLSRSGLIEALGQAAADDAELAALLARSAALHDLADGIDALADLRALLVRLQLQQVKDELTLLIESGEQSGETVARRDQLVARQRELSTAIAAGEPQRSQRPL
jgi:DNA primase